VNSLNITEHEMRIIDSSDGVSPFGRLNDPAKYWWRLIVFLHRRTRSKVSRRLAAIVSASRGMLKFPMVR
jgi:hypothetical protein